MSSPKVWFITGASSGFGRFMTEYALNQGDIVVATLRKPQVLSDLIARYSADKLLVLKVDVTKQEDIDEAFARTRSTFGRLDVVFNNAGYALITEIEGTPVDKARELFETNFWGATNVSRAAVKFFREVNEPGKGGIILQVSSVGGFYAPPELGYYAATKHALEGFSDGLAKELPDSWNINICIIEPGGFHTNVIKGATMLPQHPAYADESFATSVFRHMLETEDFEGDAQKFARTVYEVVQGGKIPKRLPMGLDALEVLDIRIENLKATIDETKGWSVDLKRADGGVRNIIIPV
ncbi:NAD(P)-binding protein [Suillus decipiens]|nr:NAD(P)-binding protein [Suillus decipiens]